MMSAGRLCAADVTSGIKRLSYSTGRTLDLSGIFPPIATPFLEDESIAYDKLEENIKKWNKIPFKGYVVQGSNGEYPFLTPGERVDMVKRVKALIPKDKLLISGSACECDYPSDNRDDERYGEVRCGCCIGPLPQLLQGQHDVPFQRFELMTEEPLPHDIALNQCLNRIYFRVLQLSALTEYFTSVADGSKVPVILYNMPVNTGIDMTAPLITSLASHPNIIGLKDSGGDITKMATVVKNTKHLSFQVIAGSTGFLLPALLVGCTGGINGLANILGEEVCQVYQLFQESRLKEAVQLHHNLVTPNSLVTRELGVPAMKAALDYVGLYGGPCRRPLQPLTSEEVHRVRDAFKAAGYGPRN
uniref:4-hydroxy-2-oxoglutarate aldolase, mitochondrial n=1 Tax=Timema monikensis TaxID=170555 RepID=A0A7R9HI45_9NEOP|nr:unnamed protein product [Timema monikensis]